MLLQYQGILISVFSLAVFAGTRREFLYPDGFTCKCFLEAVCGLLGLVYYVPMIFWEDLLIWAMFDLLIA